MNNANFRVVACGSGNEWQCLWPEWSRDGHVSIGCLAGSDFNPEWDTERTIAYIDRRIKETGRPGIAKGQASVIQGFKDFEEGDYVIINCGLSKVLALGVIKGPVALSKNPLSNDHYLYRKVDWITSLKEPIEVALQPGEKKLPRRSTANLKVTVTDAHKINNIDDLIRSKKNGADYRISRINHILNLLKLRSI